MHRQPAGKEVAGNKTKSRARTQKRNSRTVFERNNLEAKKKSTFVANGIAAHKNYFPIRH